MASPVTAAACLGADQAWCKDGRDDGSHGQQSFPETAFCFGFRRVSLLTGNALQQLVVVPRIFRLDWRILMFIIFRYSRFTPSFSTDSTSYSASVSSYLSFEETI
jgi:hypothetical protein